MITLAALLLQPPAPQLDFRRAWLCDSRSEFDGNTTSVIRTLDKDGVQLHVSIQWFVRGWRPSRPFSASISGIIDHAAPGDPPLRKGTVLVSWTGRLAEGADASSPVVVLHRKEESPRRDDGRPPIRRSDGTFSAEVPWSRLSAISPSVDLAKVSLINAHGEVIHSSSVDVRQIRRALEIVEEALKETRWQMHDYRNQCEPVTEHLRF